MPRETDEEDDKTSSSGSSVCFGDENRQTVEKFCPYSDCSDYKRPYDPPSYKGHIYQYHSQSYFFRFLDDQGKKVSVRVERRNGILVCDYCSRKYRSFNSLRWHLFRNDKECSALFFKSIGSRPKELGKSTQAPKNLKEPKTTQDVTNKVEIVAGTRMKPEAATHPHKCNLCFRKYKTPGDLREHILRTNADCSTDDLVTDYYQGAIPPELADPDLSNAPRNPRRSALMTNFGVQRSYEQAVTHACQSNFYTPSEKTKNSWIIDKIKLRPFSLFYRNDKSNIIEFNGLTHLSNIETIDGLTLECRAIESAEPKLKRVVGHYMDGTFDRFTNFLRNSPYTNLFTGRNYHELGQETCVLLNKDWNFEPHIKYSNAQVLAGAILVNFKTEQAIYINTLEVYGVTNTVDGHRGIPEQSPDSCKSAYEDLWVSSQTTSKITRICISTYSCQILVTSAFRLDVEKDFMVGNSSLDFEFESEDIRIYIDNQSMTKTRELTTDFAALSVETFNLTGQLRDIRSQFDHKSTYFLCRAASYLARPHFCRPITVFTFCESDFEYPNPKNKPMCLAISHLFQQIAYYTIKEGSKSKLPKDLVLAIINQYHVRNKAKVLFNALIDLFGDSNEIHILGNTQLNKDILTKMALLIEPEINKANKAVIDSLQQRLKSL